MSISSNALNSNNPTPSPSTSPTQGAERKREARKSYSVNSALSEPSPSRSSGEAPPMRLSQKQVKLEHSSTSPFSLHRFFNQRSSGKTHPSPNSPDSPRPLQQVPTPPMPNSPRNDSSNLYIPHKNVKIDQLLPPSLRLIALRSYGKTSPSPTSPRSPRTSIQQLEEIRERLLEYTFDFCTEVHSCQADVERKPIEEQDVSPIVKKFTEEWQAFSEWMNASLANCSQDTEKAEGSEKIALPCTTATRQEAWDKVTLRSLGLDLLLNLKSIEASMERNKGDQGLEIMLSHFERLFLEPAPGMLLLQDGANKKKISQLQRKHSADIKIRDEHAGFHYAARLIMIGEILKQFKFTNSQAERDNPMMRHAEAFANDIKGIKALHHFDLGEKIKIVDYYCEAYGNCLIEYAKNLTKFLRNYLMTVVEIPPEPAKYFPSMENTLKRRLLLNSCEFSFAEDFKRALIGGFLSISSDKQEISVPILTDEARTPNNKEYDRYHTDLMAFFIQNLGIQDEALSLFNPIEIYRQKKTMGHMYEEFEKIWRKEHVSRFFSKRYGMNVNSLQDADLNSEEIKISQPLRTLQQNGFLTKDEYEEFTHLFKQEIEHYNEKASFEGVFKLLPILRAFQQFILLTPHSGMIAVERFIAENIYAKMIRECPIDKSVPRFTSDRDTKKIHFEFKEETLIVTVWRQGMLEKPPTPGSQRLDFTLERFAHCLISSTVTLKASVRDMSKWDIRVSFEIQRDYSDPDNFTLIFLERYAEMITVLEIMGVPYTISNIS